MANKSDAISAIVQQMVNVVQIDSDARMKGRQYKNNGLLIGGDNELTQNDFVGANQDIRVGDFFSAFFAIAAFRDMLNTVCIAIDAATGAPWLGSGNPVIGLSTPDPTTGEPVGIEGVTLPNGTVWSWGLSCIDRVVGVK